jgi:hypothetical protein
VLEVEDDEVEAGAGAYLGRERRAEVEERADDRVAASDAFG